jgi:ABC-type nitrate/sulfonate/bicarbonate transport system substrate-binding protein
MAGAEVAPAMSKNATTLKPKAPPARKAAVRSSVIRLGYVPLLDAAPLLVAEELGLFEKAGLRVELCSEMGWGTVREKIVYGELEATHAPGGLLLSILFGTHAPACAVSTDFILNLQGNAITLSRRLWSKGVRDGQTLKLMIRSEAPHRPVFAVVSPFSSHHFLMRKWLRNSGIDPDHDVRIAVLPPPLVGEHMNVGHIDGFCAGEPWNSLAALNGDGWIVATSETLERNHPEKILLCRDTFIHGRAEEYAELRKALSTACRYCDVKENRPALVEMMLARKWFPGSHEALANALIGPYSTGAAPAELRDPFVSFYRGDANRATRQRAAWILESTLESGALRLDASQRRAALGAFLEPQA